MINLKGTGSLDDLLSKMTTELQNNGFFLQKHIHRKIAEAALHILVYSYQSLDGKSGLSLTISFSGSPEDWAVDILCANPFNDAFWAKRPTSQKKEELASDYLRNRGFVQVFDIPIQTEDEARYFFQTMSCSHEAMEKSFPLRYEEYKSLKISQVTENSWISKGKFLEEFSTDNLKKHWQQLKNDLSGLVSETIRIEIPKEPDENVKKVQPAATEDKQENVQGGSVESEPDTPSVTIRSPHIANAVKHYEDIVVKRSDKKRTITNLRQAKKFFIEMNGNHQRMRSEFPERYEEYRNVNVTRAHEEKWRKKLKR